MGENWDLVELKAAVTAYIEMREKQANGEKFTKKSYYVTLAAQFGRSAKSFEFRMQNISYVYSAMGRQWLTGLKPAKHVGTQVAGKIEAIIHKLEEFNAAPVAQLQSSVDLIKKKGNLALPKGSPKPEKANTGVSRYKRDAQVIAWILNEAKGKCENCDTKAPFLKDDGTPYLEVHHLKMLADGGSDTVENAAALCPNCHREFHFGRSKDELKNKIYKIVERLVPE